MCEVKGIEITEMLPKKEIIKMNKKSRSNFGLTMFKLFLLNKKSTENRQMGVQKREISQSD